ncbi:hypothetical protein XAP412_370097 [Xanthomonas phaseoli pv. phaseoli]|uniref:Uncharacterized protein n=1 Tax=Xanthomonas campestris pv. phaseoli TaxID=317013 RepID=A0AB38E0A4_XANCH|nr:hypothetical protein XAP6984_420148 [Xanthomonas phaseoli pv. phaseoli]SON84693.1 hypothetical protein XAP412_370097 [Xanthomonas phaseoli pv. phaseoli]SON89097.1 hypothetical protein XAP7430_400165 [Xanthomonas phaseoli pv. phaseoli]
MAMFGVWSDLTPGTRDQAAGYGRPGGEDCPALKQRQAAKCAQGPASTSNLRPPMPRRWTPSIALRYKHGGHRHVRQACDRTMATMMTRRSSSTPTAPHRSGGRP